jgi:hypothetical protein
MKPAESPASAAINAKKESNAAAPGSPVA